MTKKLGRRIWAVALAVGIGALLVAPLTSVGQEADYPVYGVFGGQTPEDIEAVRKMRRESPTTLAPAGALEDEEPVAFQYPVYGVFGGQTPEDIEAVRKMRRESPTTLAPAAEREISHERITFGGADFD